MGGVGEGRGHEQLDPVYWLRGSCAAASNMSSYSNCTDYWSADYPWLGTNRASEFIINIKHFGVAVDFVLVKWMWYISSYISFGDFNSRPAMGLQPG